VAAAVLIVLVLLTGPLTYLPVAALAAVVFLIAVELIDIAGMRYILSLRKQEFAVALLTATAVVVLGVEYRIALLPLHRALGEAPGTAGPPPGVRT
jgi:MFS superfamily sulfate permease-like transporter